MSLLDDLRKRDFGMSAGVEEAFATELPFGVKETPNRIGQSDAPEIIDPYWREAELQAQIEIEQHTPGAKMDQDKMDLSLLQLLPNALIEICRVMDYGQTKYTRGGFLSVPDAPRRYSSAMQRHWLKELFEKFDSGDPFYDTEAGLPFKGNIRHDAQVAVNALFRLECAIREEQEDEALMLQAEQYDEDY